jgi:hypothetical protein
VVYKEESEDEDDDDDFEAPDLKKVIDWLSLL